ncbi:sugar ABC transporter substrate-binding protein [Arthrobacter sp. FW305-BF8]|uniref:sugar ABC transporter substrate-binding protein n=1 Tax=Arthrobacter sp. FW305-BF8 TaxID=2879617 RepID=UPI001F42CF78|nr:sugar ABC transporter substrate-binding protein [Arthrobacter sp. FW305-BF8]UKA55214.1 sugar ABC transporter substrate-binding protein [Arthrobacter sp. FW305-BF8]
MNRLKTLRRIALLASGAVLSVTAITGCGNNASGTNDGEKVVGYSQVSLSEPFQVTLSNLFLQNAKDIGLKTVENNANQDSQKQFSGIQSMIQAGAKGLVINAVDAKSVVPAIGYANGRNIPVVAIDSAPAGGDVYMVIQADNTDMAAKACKALGEGIGGQGEVLMINGSLKNSSGIQRQQGFLNCMKQSFPNVTLYDEVANWDPAKAASIAQTVLTAHPKIKAIYLATDTLYLTPVWSVLERLGMAHPAGESGHIFMASIDGSPTGLAGIRAGHLDVSISQPLDRYAEFGAKYIQAALDGQKQEPGETDHGPVKEVDGLLVNFIPSDIVTKDNVEESTLWGNLAAKK